MIRFRSKLFLALVVVTLLSFVIHGLPYGTFKWETVREALGQYGYGGPPGPPDTVGPPDHAGPPDHVGPPDHAGPPDHVGPPRSKSIVVGERGRPSPRRYQ